MFFGQCHFFREFTDYAFVGELVVYIIYMMCAYIQGLPCVDVDTIKLAKRSASRSALRHMIILFTMRHAHTWTPHFALRCPDCEESCARHSQRKTAVSRHPFCAENFYCATLSNCLLCFSDNFHFKTPQKI